MSRYFNNQAVELLAPVGNFEIFKEVIHSGADAVYLGGKIFNMRMHRKDFNFTNEELEEAIKIAHSLKKKIYITVNNLLSSYDLTQAEDYLRYLEKLGPDALIVQDMSVIDLIRTLGLNLNIHSSVMMNVHNFETIKALEELGVTRVVTSRDIDLKTIKQFSVRTNMEFEYFVHGDMCVAHGAQCLYSGILFGKSGNRGLCMKPCRWGYKINKEGQQYDTTFPMAVKDMYMYEHIPELIEAGVVSFKIEGRMRDASYLVDLINYYSDAIDRYIDDPISYNRKKHAKELFENRKRDFSTAYAFGNPGLSNINERYEGTGKFYSTGKVFSNPVDEFDIKEERVSEIKDILSLDEGKINKPELTVKVNNYEAAMLAINEGVDKIYLSGEVFEPDAPFTKEEIINITKSKKNSKIYLGLPRMMFEDDFSKYNHLLRNNDLGIDGLLVTNLGAISKFKDLGLELVGDYSLNIYNALSANFYKNLGLEMATLSCESPVNNTKDSLLNSELDLEIIVNGSPVVMYMSHDLYENTNVINPSGVVDRKFNDKKVLLLIDDKGNEHPVYRDNTGKNHMLLSKELCYMPILKELANLGAKAFRIEGCHYDNHTLKTVISSYKKAISNLEQCNKIFKELEYDCLGFTLGAMQFN
ncbi:peptidase U32 family protein [Clostridium celatum]|uniref:Peptidase, U32 family n=1 Tax=Clostridium celatum DSM 1785 TaxID=545697 RepID=L1Q5K9_9CLOT|nr:U32 family peptidase [Clostridium celatum]EKY23258.1 peptidase, U32 family [Clostridium celatum DSM 1785]MCE9655993.1 U32 family peptidase [Clostridium celatum]MDU3722930.1 U32 family peptidase [Clostridium celatum]